MSECLPNWAPLTQIPIGIKIVFSQECFILWTQHLSNIKELLDKKYNKQKVLEWKRKWAHAQLVKGLAYLTPKSGDPRPPVLFPAPNHTTIDIWQNWTENRRVAEASRIERDISKDEKCGRVPANIISTATDMFPSIPALPGCGAWGIEFLWHKEETRNPFDDD